MAGNVAGAEHAVIVGGSIAGLLAAAALSSRCRRVTVVERDTPPDRPGARRGTPHDGHCHALLAAGAAGIERLVPGFDAELAAAGADSGDALEDVACSLEDGWVPRWAIGLRTRAASRRLIEWTLRRRVAALANVTLVSGARVLEPLASSGRVCGVRFADGGVLSGDAVVEATGRGSRLPDWLEREGFGRPVERSFESGLAYASQRFVRPTESLGWKAMLIVADAGPHPAYGAIYPEEKGLWAVALAGARGTVPPREPEGFMAFARGLRSPALHDAIARAQPVEPVMTWRATANRVRCYHRMRRWPEGLFVLGDAVAALNPIYGQGMTLAALGAVALGEAFAQGPARESGLRFQRRLARINRVPWLLATSEDSRFSAGAPLSVRLVRLYTDRLRRRLPDDPALARAFMRTLQLVEPAACLRPGAVLRVLRPVGRQGVRKLDRPRAPARISDG